MSNNFSCRHPTCFSSRLLWRPFYYRSRSFCVGGAGMDRVLSKKFIFRSAFRPRLREREWRYRVRLRRTRLYLAQICWTAALFCDKFCFRNTIITYFRKQILSTLSNCFKCPKQTFDLLFGSFQSEHFSSVRINDFWQSVANFFSCP